MERQTPFPIPGFGGRFPERFYEQTRETKKENNNRYKKAANYYSSMNRT